MRRILASLLLAVISFALVPIASAEPDLPACCRKDGKHKCGMMDDPSGTSFRGVSQCPMLPKSNAAPVSGVVGAPVPGRDQVSTFAAFLKRPEQAEAQYRVSFNRSRQKRAPPSRFSSMLYGRA